MMNAIDGPQSLKKGATLPPETVFQSEYAIWNGQRQGLQ